MCVCVTDSRFSVLFAALMHIHLVHSVLGAPSGHTEPLPLCEWILCSIFIIHDLALYILGVLERTADVCRKEKFGLCSHFTIKQQVEEVLHGGSNNPPRSCIRLAAFAEGHR